MSNSNINPAILARMRKEVSFLESQQRGPRRIKLAKGHSITVRFLPARLGKDGAWFVRIAQHWLNKVPIACPRLTSEDFGGDPEAHCPVCAIAEELNDDRDKAISDFGWAVKANPQYLTYCLLLEKDGQEVPMEEIVKPYQFQLNRSTWEELNGFYMAGGRRSPDSVLDYQKGNDFSVIRAKSYRLDKLDSCPIFDDGPEYAKTIKKIEAECKDPKIQIPTAAQLEAFADKVQSAAMRLNGRSPGSEDDYESDAPRRRRGRPAEEDEQEDRPRSRSRYSEGDEYAQEDRPRRQRAYEDEDRPARRRAEEAEPDEQDRESDRRPAARRSSEPEEVEEPPRRRPTREEAADEEPPRRSRQAEAEEEDARPQSRRRQEPEEVDDVDLGPAPKPSRRKEPEEEDVKPRGRKPQALEAEEDPEPVEENDREPEAEAEPEPEPDPEESPRAGQTRGKLSPTANRAREEQGGGSGKQAQAQAEDDPEELPEEAKDQAPPTKKPLERRNEQDEPPLVQQKGGKVADAIQSRLQGLGRRGQ